MATEPQRHPLPAGNRTLPFLGYAQLVRMLVPPVSRIGFYDGRGAALWVSDGGEGPELDKHIGRLLARDDARGNPERSGAYTAVEDGDRIFLFTVDDGERGRLGAVGIVCRDMASAASGSARTIARLLTPLIEVLRDAWALRAEGTRPRMQAAATTARENDATTAEIAVADSVDDENLPPLAMLRRTLASLTQGRQCSFGAILASNPAFTLSHRVSLEESDLTVTAAIDNARARLFESRGTDGKPVIVNEVTPGRSDFSPHKVLALPLRCESQPVTALLVLFRNRHQRDFTRVDVDSLRDTVPRYEEKLLSALAARREGVPAMPQAKPQASITTAAVADSARRAAEPVAATDGVVSMDERVRAALAEDGFSLLAQRIIPLRNTNRPARFEILLRLRDGDTSYAPAAFFAAAQTRKLMPRLDEWVVRSLLKTLRDHANAVHSGGWEFCVNVARQSLASPRFGDFVVAEVGRSAIPPGLLVFELTEDDALGHRGCVDSLATRLRDVGCRIALDNCRAGLGTFGSLRDWPVSCLKIDGSVTRDVSVNAQTRSVVRALAELAAHRGIETVAECVETEEMRTTLRDIGLDFAQGFHVGQPQPLETLFR